MKPILRIPLFIGLVVLSAAAAQATTLTFENVAPAGSVLNVNPAAPYNEQGYTISVINALAAVVDSAHPTFDMPGNLTDFFGFGGPNTPTLTFTGGTFDLVSLLLGPTSIGQPSVSITLTGTLAAGGTLTASFAGLTTATEANLNWSGLQNVRFVATSDAALDNIVVNASQVPESGSLILLALGVLGVAIANTRLRRV